MDKLPEETFDKKVNVYCQLSRKRPPMTKRSPTGGGRLRENQENKPKLDRLSWLHTDIYLIS